MSRNAAQGSNTVARIAIVSGPSTQATAMAASMATAVNTASPMSIGGGKNPRVWNGDPGYGVHRWTRWLGKDNPGPSGGAAGRAITPVAIPVADSVRIGAQAGPSSPAAYPSTGNNANFGMAVAALDMSKLGKLGYGG